MNLFTATIAYIPIVNKQLIDVTRSSVASTKQFRKFGDVVVYHATNPDPPESLCAEVHECFGDTEVIEYRNGGLLDNWAVMMHEGFIKRNAELVMFVSNDIIWNAEAAEVIKMGTGTPMTYCIKFPTSVFLMHRTLYDAILPTLFVDYHPAHMDDFELMNQIVTAGGSVDLDGVLGGKLAKHDEAMLTVKALGEDYRKEGKPYNDALYDTRWGNARGTSTPKGEDIERWRRERAEGKR